MHQPPLKIRYDVPIKVSEWHYTVIMREMAEMVAGQYREGQHYVKLWMMSEKKFLIALLNLKENDNKGLKKIIDQFG